MRGTGLWEKGPCEGWSSRGRGCVRAGETVGMGGGATVQSPVALPLLGSIVVTPTHRVLGKGRGLQGGANSWCCVLGLHQPPCHHDRAFHCPQLESEAALPPSNIPPGTLPVHTHPSSTPQTSPQHLPGTPSSSPQIPPFPHNSVLLGGT